jgi:hypothetical protein
LKHPATKSWLILFGEIREASGFLLLLAFPESLETRQFTLCDMQVLHYLAAFSIGLCAGCARWWTLAIAVIQWVYSYKRGLFRTGVTSSYWLEFGRMGMV